MKLNISFVLIVLSSLIFSFSSCKEDRKDSNGCYIGLGALISEDRPIPPFTGIEIKLNAEVNLTIGTPEVSVETNSDIQAYIIVEVIDSILTISNKDNACFNIPNPIKINITADNTLNFIHNRSNATFRNTSTLALDQLTVRNSDYSLIQLNGSSNHLEIINIEGGQVEMFEFYAENTNVQQSSINPIQCRVLNGGTLSIEIISDGDVQYKGIPLVLEEMIFGNGNIIDTN